jgi:hypothetical protein
MAAATATDASTVAPGTTANPPGETAVPADDRPTRRVALALALAPFAVSAVAVLVTVGGHWLPVADHALTEMQVRDVGRHEVLVGLYSRENWNHPGPILFYVLAPFYWLTGGLGVGMSLGALAVNGVSMAGMGVVARRRGGTPLMLLTLVGCALLLRTFGADFARDPWNCFITTLPFGLLILLVWSMWCGEMWALPVGAAVATFLAQTHIGFVALALPLLAYGAVGAGLAARRGRRSARDADPAPEPHGDGDGVTPRRSRTQFVKATRATAVVLGVLWLPPFLEELFRSPGNLISIVYWFADAEDGIHSLTDGLRVMSAQLAAVPEWLTVKEAPNALTGQSPYLTAAPLPLLALPVVAACVVLWRRNQDGGRAFVLTLGLTYMLGVVAVARTVGPAFEYRLRWTAIPAMLALVAVARLGWTAAARWWPRAERRVLVPAAVAALAVLSGVNSWTAATAGSPQAGDSEAMNEIMPELLDALPADAGQVAVEDVFHSGAWIARGIVLALEEAGVDARVGPDRADLFGRHRVVDGSPDTRIVVAVDMKVDEVAEEPGMRPIAEWSHLPEDRREELEAERREVEAAIAAGTVYPTVGAERRDRVNERLYGDTGAFAFHIVVFLDESSGRAGT